MIRTMTASFASAAWAEQLASQLQESARVRTESMSWVFGPLVLLVDADAEHGLEATGIRIDLHEGAVRGVEVIPAADAVRAPFVLGGSLARWKTVFGGSLDIVDAVLDSRLRAVGDLPTLARHRDLLASIAAAGGAVDTAWQDEQVEAAASPS
jgi:putative sterol carrier protein